MGPRLLIICLFIFSFSYSQKGNLPYIIVLGTIQDAGSPHMGCEKPCCISLFESPDPNRKVVSLGLVDPLEKKYWLIEASPDFITQCRELNISSGFEHGKSPDGIFLTHAHIGHYTGLMYLGKEAINSQKTKVFGMPRMNKFLRNNGPWDQLVSNNNIELYGLEHRDTVFLSKQLQIIPFLVPHRDEYSETVGYKIIGPNRKALFIPDIDKWKKWNN